MLFDSPGPKTRRNILLVNIAAAVVVLFALYLVGRSLHSQGQLSVSRWNILWLRSSWTTYLLPGLLNTIKAALVAIVGAFAFGLLFGAGRLSPILLVRLVAGAVVEFFRAVPVLLMMIFFWSFLPNFYLAVGWAHPPDASFVAVVIALILYNGSVCADLVRSGVQNLPNGQHEAAAAIGLRPNQALFYVLVPQALLAMLPALIAQLVVALKDSALGQIISYAELLREARLLGSPLKTLQALIIASAIFILINYGLGQLGERLAHRMRSRTSPLGEDMAEDIPMNVSARAASEMLVSVDQDGYNQEEWPAQPPGV